MSRRLALAGTLLLLATSGCSDDLAGDLYGNDVDLRRAERVWSDPWVAPSRLQVPRAGYGSNGWVDRSVGGRTTTYVGVGARAAVRAEVAAGRRDGWNLVGATCADDGIRAVLTRGGTDLDRAAVAVVTTDTADPAPTDGGVAVDVAAQVPHHVDDDWPDLGAAVPVATTCLAGGDADPAPELPDGEPRGTTDGDVETPSWPDDDPSTADQARLAALAADSWFRSLDAPTPEPDTASGDQVRHAPAVEGDSTPGPRRPAAAVAAVVADMHDWLLTYAACSAATGAVATLRLDTEDGPVVARLESVPGDRGRVAWRVAVPVADGPGLGWIDDVPALATSRCLDGAPTRARTAEGTPVGVPDEQQPMQ